MLIVLFSFLFSFFIVQFLMPFTRRVALQFRLVDKPGGRKIHNQPIPLSGGPAVFIGIAVTLLLFIPQSYMTPILLVGALALGIAGLIDDAYKAKGKDFPAWPKLAAQILTALFVYQSGIELYGITNPMHIDGFIVFPEWISLPATILWIVSFINMFNFIDGVDGLASGVSTISGITLFFIGFVRGQADILLPIAVLVGASVAFLRHNFHPATVFLGDTGSMVLGYMLAVISLAGAMKGATLVTIGVTLLALGFPVLDTIQVMIRRIKEGSPVYKADRRHVHHRLLASGLTQRQTVWVVYAISIIFSMIAIVLLFLTM
ncbi:MraY family glycosyltransferase [Aneurinibacillus tyrosinisolvens]|uniref:MraY family glycosyltransferase n=1 Tax=Aneurinibacillus tyrosinisolvens TaxID=1443435 RepID=UPI00063F0F1B|nr:MraY family glycosyltransferase [Aneurinibacillus tyrosinisolvens]